MKKLHTTTAFICVSILCAVPAHASDWSTPYDMPRVAYDSSAFDIFVDSIKITLGAISNTGISILGILLSVGLIAIIFSWVFSERLRIAEGVRHREFNRKVSSADRARNLDSIVDDRVGAMEVSYLAKNRFRLRHPTADLEEKIYQRQLSYQAQLADREANPRRDIEESKYRLALSDDAYIEFYGETPESDFYRRSMRKTLENNFHRYHGKM